MRKTCLLKVLAVTVISDMCAPFVTACNNEQKDDRTTVPTHTKATAGVPDIEEPNQTAETLPSETSESEAETAAPDGMYTYTLYEGTPNEMKISMGVDLDEYIMTNSSGKEVFKWYQLASDLGWLEQGKYTWADIKTADPNDSSIYSNWFDFSYGDHRAIAKIDDYSEDMPGSNYSQIMSIWFSYLENGSSAPFFEDGPQNPSHQGIVLFFEKHYDSVSYSMTGLHCNCSRDDAVVIAYGLWYFANNPDDSSGIRSMFSDFVGSKGFTLP